MNTYTQDAEQNITPDEALSPDEREAQARDGIECGMCDGVGKSRVYPTAVIADCPVCFGLGRIWSDDEEEGE